MKEIIIQPREEGQRFDKFLRRYLQNAGNGFIYKMLRKKNIKLNDGKASGKEILKDGDKISIYFSDQTLEAFTENQSTEASKTQESDTSGHGIRINAEMEHLIPDILYEDEAVLILNKPAGLLSQPDRSNALSAVEWIREYLLHSGTMSEEDFRFYRPGVVNRLDRNTSGILLAAKNLKAASELSEWIRLHQIQKYYLALVKGDLSHPGSLQNHFYTKKSDSGSISRIGKSTSEDGKIAKLNYWPISQHVIADRQAALLQIELMTGKTHQIRTQFSAIAHPLAGDPKYGDPAWNLAIKRKYGLRRQFLHAYRIVFPVSEGYLSKLSGMQLEAPIPADLQFYLKNQ